MISCTMSDGTIEVISIKSLAKNHSSTKAGKWDVVNPRKLKSLQLQQPKAAKTQMAPKKPKAIQMSVDKLRDYLSANGGYAEKYRTLIWSFLLNVPNLESAYEHHRMS